MAILNNSNAISTTGGYDIKNSLRTRASASAYLSRSPASSSSQSNYTLSFWVKRGSLGANQTLLSCVAYGNASYQTYFRFNSSDQLEFYNSWGSDLQNIITTQVFRDPSAWYHIVFAINMNAGTRADAIKMYVNGSLITAFSTTTYINVFQATAINSTDAHNINRNINTSSLYFDGYLAEVNFIDGNQLAVTLFGSTNATTGVWQPIKYTGTYGTNGYYLNFNSIATTSGSNTGLGKDDSGNGNYWNTNNISVTAGTTYDAMLDVPTNTSATVANYAVLNPLWKSSNIILAGANLNVTSSGSGGSSLSTIAMESGKYYCELRLNSSTDATIIGIANSSFNPTTSGLTSANAVGYYTTNGDKFVNGTQSAYGASCASGDIVGIAVDITAGTVTFYKNNTSQGAITHGLTGPFYFATSDASSGSNIDQSWNFGQRPFAYTPPTGYVALNTYNLPDSTIKKGNTVMDATLYTGNNSGQTVVNAGQFKPDLVWIKARSIAYNNRLVDSVQGNTSTLVSNSTAAAVSMSTQFNSFNSNGFSVTNDVTYGLNESPQTYVGWQWQAGQGSTSSNTLGSITSTVSVNTTAGFSVATWTGNGTVGATVGHSLGVAPKMVIMKRRDGATNWQVWITGFNATTFLFLQSTNAVSTAENYFNSTLPSSTLLTLSANSEVNASGGTYVAYCWSEISGYSKFGSYTGNGSTDGPMIYCNFSPKFFLVKRTDAVESWNIVDTSRNTYNQAGANLYPNLSNAESTNNSCDILSNGIKLRNTWAGANANGGTYIFMAFASNPFKSSNAR